MAAQLCCCGRPLLARLCCGRLLSQSCAQDPISKAVSVFCQRLQRLLAARGAEASEAYSRRVTARYEELAAAAGVDPQRTADQFSVQELNRRARDLVRDEVLAEAPDEVRREVLAEVNVGRKPV